MKLLTKELQDRIPRLYVTREEPDPIAQVRFVSAWPTPAEWYAVEYDGRNTFYGLIARPDTRSVRLVYFSLGVPGWRAFVEPVNVGDWKHVPRVVAVLRYDTDFDPKPVTRLFPGVVL